MSMANRVNLYLDPETYRKITQIANEFGFSRSQTVKYLIKIALKELKQK